MKSKKSVFGAIGRTVMALMLAMAMCLAGVGTAFAAPAEPYWTPPDQQVTPDPNLLTTYGVRAGSAGPDFLGISNTNFDFSTGSAASPLQYTGYNAATLGTVAGGSGLAIWATSVNEEPNPYYQNLYYNQTLTPTGTATQATTWMSNSVGSWGDSNSTQSNKGNVSTGAQTIAGLEFDPDIIFGANKITGWQNALSNGTNSQTVLSSYFANNPWTNYGPTWTSNDATNIWGQIYTLGQLAGVAENLKVGTTKETRYSNNAITEAVNYEKAIRGNLLYVASQIDTGEVEQKTVAYLYSIDSNGVGYFFTPTAKDLLVGNDTGKAPTSETNPDANYAANNSTINMGYMATLPFITNTFDSGNEFPGGIIMGVEDIFKANPACTVSTDVVALAKVDVLIYNTTTLRGTALIGDQQGRNNSGITISNNYDSGYVATWAQTHGFPATSTLIAGDDFYTSYLNQGYGTVTTTVNGMSPMLYCQRNYTADKNAKAAWGFAQVYPELYEGNADATYAYWVDNVYHIYLENPVTGNNDVSTVATYMTNKSAAVVYTQDTVDFLEECFETGMDWWKGTGSADPDWNQYTYYTGSSRASYYSGNSASEEPANTIGIFAPTLWS